MFESSVPAIASNGWAPASNGFQSRPTEPELDPIDQSPMSPGEHRESRAYRQRSGSDIWIPALTNFLSTGIVMVSSAATVGVIRAMLIPQGWPAWIAWARGPQLWAGENWWVVSLAAGVGTMGYLWFDKQLPDLLDDMKLVTTEQESSRPQEVAPIIQAPPAVDIVINSGNKQTRATLTAPKSNHAGLWKYADALLRGTAAASIDGGKGDDGILGAKRFGYTPAEFDAGPGTWRPTAIAGGILEDDPTKSKGYRLTPDGQRAMAQIVKYQRGRVFV